MFRDQVKFPFERKMLGNILLGVVILVFSACGGTKKPADVLSEKEMVYVLTELYIAEEKLSGIGAPYDSLKMLSPQFSSKAFEKAGVSDTVFRKSMDYYMTNPDRLEEIFETVVDSLNLQSQRVEIQRRKNAPVE